AVAAGARHFGCKCVIFLHQDVSEWRQTAIESYGASVIRTEGLYDHSVQRAREMSEQNGWYLVADTSDDPADPIPRLVMQGYSIMVREAIAQMAKRHAQVTHVFLQGGVGAMAASIVAYLWEEFGALHVPTFIM